MSCPNCGRDQWCRCSSYEKEQALAALHNNAHEKLKHFGRYEGKSLMECMSVGCHNRAEAGGVYCQRCFEEIYASMNEPIGIRGTIVYVIAIAAVIFAGFVLWGWKR